MAAATPASSGSGASSGWSKVSNQELAWARRTISASTTRARARVPKQRTMARPSSRIRSPNRGRPWSRASRDPRISPTTIQRPVATYRIQAPAARLIARASGWPSSEITRPLSRRNHTWARRLLAPLTRVKPISTQGQWLKASQPRSTADRIARGAGPLMAPRAGPAAAPHRGQIPAGSRGGCPVSLHRALQG